MKRSERAKERERIAKRWVDGAVRTSWGAGLAEYADEHPIRRWLIRAFQGGYDVGFAAGRQKSKGKLQRLRSQFEFKSKEQT